MTTWHHRSLRAALVAGVSAVAVLAANPPLSPAAADTLREALADAYRTNPNLEAGRAQLRATDELVSQALAGNRPRAFINGGLEAARGEVGRTQAEGLGGFGPITFPDGSTIGGGPDPNDGSRTSNRTSKQIGLSLQQNLYAGGGTTARIRQAENQVSAARADLIATEQQILLDAVDAYATVWQDRRVLDLALNNEQRLGRQLQATRDRFEVGEVARTDVAQAEARLSRARADIESAKANLAASRARYRRVIGEEPGVLENPEPIEQLPPTFEQALAIAANNPSIINATFALSAARDAVRAEIADLLPSVDLTSDLSYANQPNSQTPWQREASVGVEVTVPLYQGGAEYADVRRSRAQLSQNRSNLEAAQRSVREGVASSWDRLFAARAAIRSFRDEVRANRIALEGVQQEALVGSRTVLDVLDAEQELFTSEVNLVRAQRELVVASYQLKSAIGELTVDDLRLGVETFDPTAYYQRNRTRLFGLEGGG
jgi:TolC family type I secretion outer membrane protein